METHAQKAHVSTALVRSTCRKVVWLGPASSYKYITQDTCFLGVSPSHTQIQHTEEQNKGS